MAHMKSRLNRHLLALPNLNPARGPLTLACRDLIDAQKAHGRALKLGVSIGESNIADSYCEAKAFSDARRLFDEVSGWDVVSATCLIGSFARHRCHEEAIYLFSKMLALSIRPNEFTIGTLVHLCTAIDDLNLGKQLHACAAKTGCALNVFVGSAILDLYSKLSTIKEAGRAFDDTDEPNVVSYTTLISGYLKNDMFDDAIGLFRTMPERNVVSWNAMICGYSQNGQNEEAVNLFIEMLREGMLPNQSTFPCAISAASNIAALRKGRSFHACAIKYLGKLNVFVGNSLISLYAKCGSMEDSLLVFEKLPEKNVVSWNALICGYAQNGGGSEAIDSFHKMESTGLRPNSVTLLGLLLACNHVGLVDVGYSYFNQIKLTDPGMLKSEHYACIVNLFSRSGRFKEAEKFISDLPFDPGIGFWKALLGGCHVHSNTELEQFAAQKIRALDPQDVSSYVMLSNAYSAAGSWQSVSMIRQEMREKGMARIPGCSWIEIKDRVYVFVNGDKGHDQTYEIYMVLKLFLEHVMEAKASKLHSTL